MAINYTQVFGDLGKLIARSNSYNSIAGTTLPADLLLLLNQFSNRWLSQEGVAAFYEGLKDNVVGWKQGVASFGSRRLLDHETVGKEMQLPFGAGIEAVRPALIAQMIRDGQTVEANVCAASAVSAASANKGNGSAWITTTLDGVNAPLAGGLATIHYEGRRTELCVPSETMTLECVADSGTDRLIEGSERFRWYGGPAYPPLDYRTEGSGEGPGVQVSEGSALVQGGTLDDWASSLPSGWEALAGTAGTDWAQETTAANVYRGTSSVRFIGGGAATKTLGQTLSPQQFQSKRMYFIGIAVRASAAAADATFRLRFTGTGYSGLADEQVQLAGASFPTVWTQYGAFISMPTPIPADWRLTFGVEGLPAGVDVYADSVQLKDVQYHGGVGLAVTPGAIPWARGDRLTWTVSNNQAGAFQEHFRRWHRCQLPSEGSAGFGFLPPLPMTLMIWGAAVGASISDLLVA